MILTSLSCKMLNIFGCFILKKKKKRHLCEVVLAVIYLQTSVYSSGGADTEQILYLDRGFNGGVRLCGGPTQQQI